MGWGHGAADVSVVLNSNSYMDLYYLHSIFYFILIMQHKLEKIIL
jgi:hypothetical protein